MAKRYRLTRTGPSSRPAPAEAPEPSNETRHYDNAQRHPYVSRNAPGTTPAHQQPYYSQQSGQLQDAARIQNIDRTRTGGVHRKSSGHGWMWAFLSLLALIVIVGVIVWMSDVSSSLHHINHTTQQNAHSLAHQNAQLTGIRAQLHQISQQLARISQQISTFFANLMQTIRSAKF